MFAALGGKRAGCNDHERGGGGRAVRNHCRIAGDCRTAITLQSGEPRMRIFSALVVLTLCIVVTGTARLHADPLSDELAARLPAERKGQVLLYGAYGFTGKGIARLAARYDIVPVLSGRNPEKLQALADEVGYTHVPLTLDNHDRLVEVLRHFELVMHIAGPYTYTAKPMLDAAVEATHYVDLTGEMHVIQAQLDRHEEFRSADIMVMPAVGFDVVPTDCLNLYVARKVQNPLRLELLINSDYETAEGAQASRGTIKSGLEMLSRPLLMRIDGQMIEVEKPKVVTREIDGQSRKLVQIPWADMVTSWVSTGVPTIEVYQHQSGELPDWVLWLIRRQWGKDMLIWLVDHFFPEGPPPEARAQRRVQLIATASNARGESFSAEMITPEPYRLTFHSALIVARRILNGQWEAGFQTPAKLYGPDLALEIPGVSRRDL
ncbi:MAG: saccharopine dehydrogenase NADP-binding domain-containing protein [Halioglobus sp.]|nr:saccharopine dehydrogenase NADP-binding domain-containing protein [Halioglobus sp.]